MRRVVVVLCSSLFLQLAVTSPALAWWDFLEELSGPGWWKGIDVDARLFCLVDGLPALKQKTLVDRMQKAGRPRFSAFSPQTQVPEAGQERRLLDPVSAEVGQWTKALDEWEEILNEWQLLSGGVADKVAVLRLPLGENRRRADDSLAKVVPAVQAWIDSKGKQSATEAISQAQRDAERAAEAFKLAAESTQHVVDGTRLRAAALPGVIYSACRLQKNERRRASFDVGMRFFWTNDDRYANGERISLTTFEPAFAWHVFDNPRYDILEYGLGAGVYWISSKAFPSVRGGFLEPARFDLHFPTGFVKNDAMGRKIIRSLVLRVGYLTFPGGFEPDAFLADPLNPETHRRIGRDWVRYYGIYIDTEVFRKKS